MTPARRVFGSAGPHDARGPGAAPLGLAPVPPPQPGATVGEGLPPAGAADRPTDALVAHLHRIDDLVQERSHVLGHVHRVDAHELFTLARADLWLRREELAAISGDERATVTALVWARTARTLARRNEGRSVPPVDHAAIQAARSLPPSWRHLPGPTLLADPETAVFRAMALLTEQPRSVLVLRWLGVGVDEIADELHLGADAVDRLLRDARAQLRGTLGAGGGAR